MRLVMIGLAAAGALAAMASPSAAQSPWGPGTYCTQTSLFSDDWSSPDCRFYSYEQCRGTADGMGMSCMRNPYAQPAAPARRAKAAVRKKTRR